MDADDLEPRHARPQKKNLDIMSVEELDFYVLELQAEIDRARQAIAAKQDHRSSAEALFRKS